MTQFCPDPPPKCEISHFFFFERDLPLVSDDQKKFKAHKTLLRTRSKFCSKNLKDDQFYQVHFNEKDTKKMLEIIYCVKVPTKEEEVKFKNFLKPAFFKCKECPKSDFKTNRDLNKHIQALTFF